MNAREALDRLSEVTNELDGNVADLRAKQERFALSEWEDGKAPRDVMGGELTDEEIEKKVTEFSERTSDLWDNLDDHARYVMGYRRGYEECAKAKIQGTSNTKE